MQLLRSETLLMYVNLAKPILIEVAKGKFLKKFVATNLQRGDLCSLL